jgi:hypothetical protein
MLGPVTAADRERLIEGYPERSGEDRVAAADAIVHATTIGENTSAGTVVCSVPVVGVPTHAGDHFHHTGREFKTEDVQDPPERATWPRTSRRS